MKLKLGLQHIGRLGLEGVYWPPFDSLTLSLSQLRVSLYLPNLFFSRISLSLGLIKAVERAIIKHYVK